MGRLSAEAMAEAAPLELALEWHLTANHYPPVTRAMIPACIAAIEFGRDEDFDALVDLPEGVTYKDQPQAPAGAIIEQHHLETWVMIEDLEDDFL